MIQTMVYDTQNQWDSGLCPSSGISLENATFRKVDMFPSSDEGRQTSTLLDPLERASVNRWTPQSRHLLFLTRGRKQIHVRFEVFTAVTMKNGVF
jgi:hypothetical protein